jgi:hypothetical protein
MTGLPRAVPSGVNASDVALFPYVHRQLRVPHLPSHDPVVYPQWSTGWRTTDVPDAVANRMTMRPLGVGPYNRRSLHRNHLCHMAAQG